MRSVALEAGFLALGVAFAALEAGFVVLEADLVALGLDRFHGKLEYLLKTLDELLSGRHVHPKVYRLYQTLDVLTVTTELIQSDSEPDLPLFHRLAEEAGRL